MPTAVTENPSQSAPKSPAQKRKYQAIGRTQRPDQANSFRKIAPDFPTSGRPDPWRKTCSLGPPNRPKRRSVNRSQGAHGKVFEGVRPGGIATAGPAEPSFRKRIFRNSAVVL